MVRLIAPSSHREPDVRHPFFPRCDRPRPIVSRNCRVGPFLTEKAYPDQKKPQNVVLDTLLETLLETLGLHSRGMTRHESASQPRTTIGRHLHAEWQAIGHSTASRSAHRALADAEPAVAAVGCSDLGELVDAVQARGPGQRLAQGDKPAVQSAMLRSARLDALIPRALVQILYPGLAQVTRSLGPLVRQLGGRDDTMSEAVALLWTFADEWAGDDRLYAGPDMLSAVLCRLRRAAVRADRDQEGRSLTNPADFDLLAADSDRSDLEALALALGDLDGHGITRADAAVMYLTRVHGYSIVEVAEMTGTAPRAIQWRRERAEGRLVA